MSEGAIRWRWRWTLVPVMTAPVGKVIAASESTGTDSQFNPCIKVEGRWHQARWVAEPGGPEVVSQTSDPSDPPPPSGA